ncbi:hypothetical protein M441DRAFT_334671 [Trichoderma asperellum CBS 433.97]|uniref:Uncharacterized protein n=1 Tax=Trichoderma asperellum (strain ATCC 204424 / CBS 433.97 / NBRC 101777) TaxID=1042311 RepID=A0A2T3YRB8_TRIA4|nr:hypothetical protein M441DRAFT_334671 [Trichoderma asperellum CBS 433.97]PTB35069.1 hypothetical protein M441DRAFT_334671 [Trichoderma asperellum CBS 433.97]
MPSRLIPSQQSFRPTAADLRSSMPFHAPTRSLRRSKPMRHFTRKISTPNDD